MKKSIFIILIAILSSCVSNSDIRKLNNEFDIVKREYSNRFSVDLFTHFPDTITRDFIYRMPIMSNSHFYKSYVMVCDYDANSKKIESILKDSTIYHTKYSAEKLMILNHLNLDTKEFKDDKCNVLHEDKYPIPYFDFVYFDLGAYKVKNEYLYEDSEIFKFVVPTDLEIYVVEAKPGFYMKNKNAKKYLNNLKEWEHAYSKGIAISEQTDCVYYWAIIW